MNHQLLALIAAAATGAVMIAVFSVLLRRGWARLGRLSRAGFSVSLGVLTLVWALFVYAALIEPRTLVVRRVEIVAANWRGAPLTVAMVSDTHVGGPHVDAVRIGRVVRRINALRPDLVVLLGDYAAGHAPEAARTPAEQQEIMGGIATFAAVQSRYGVVAVIGNHDSWYGRASITAALQSAGAAALWNRSIVIRRSGGDIVLAGLADALTGHPDFSETLDGAPEGEDTIVLSHSPDPFAEMPASLPVMLAAHTHCGQVTIPFFGRPYINVRHKDYACGRVDRAGQTLYVTGGVGTSIVPLRFLNPPEIVFVTIRGAGRARSPSP